MATLTKPEFKRSYPTWFTQIHTESRAATDARNDSASLRDRSRAIRIETDSKTKYILPPCLIQFFLVILF